MPLIIPDFLSSRLGRPVAILGGALSGEGAAHLVAKLGGTSVIYDQNGLKFDAAAARGHGLAIFSPGFPLHHAWLETARKAGSICMAEIDFASLFWKGRTVAVTGTNGKTTLTEFLTHALALAGRRSLAAGNIGIPFSRTVADEDGGSEDITAVCEVSSFQAEQLGHFSCDGLLWTNFAEDHLERHGTMESYFTAKWELVLRSAPGKFFAGSSVVRYAEQLGRPMPEGACVPTEGLPADPRLAGTAFENYPQRENAVLAEAWWKSEGLDEAVFCRRRSHLPHPGATALSRVGTGRRQALLERLEGYQLPRRRSGARRLRPSRGADSGRTLQGRRHHGLCPPGSPPGWSTRSSIGEAMAPPSRAPLRCWACPIRSIPAWRTPSGPPPRPRTPTAPCSLARDSRASTCSATTRTAATPSRGLSPNSTRPEFNSALAETNHNLNFHL